jgi:hypothetical protein
MASTIYVISQFPKTIVPDTDVFLDQTNWEWQVCLAFPIHKLRFSSKPFKWIRYATAIVVGARGDLCTEPFPVPPIDYESPVTGIDLRLYYQTTDEEKCHMIPIEPNLANTRTVTVTSQASTCRMDFCEEVMDRDRSCIISGDVPDACGVANLTPLSSRWHFLLLTLSNSTLKRS